jgi:hypothetical protein
MEKYTDFLITFTMEDGSRKDRIVSYIESVSVDHVYEYAEAVASLEDLEVTDIAVKGLEDKGDRVPF